MHRGCRFVPADTDEASPKDTLTKGAKVPPTAGSGPLICAGTSRRSGLVSRQFCAVWQRPSSRRARHRTALRVRPTKSALPRIVAGQQDPAAVAGEGPVNPPLRGGVVEAGRLGRPPRSAAAPSPVLTGPPTPGENLLC